MKKLKEKRMALLAKAKTILQTAIEEVRAISEDEESSYQSIMDEVAAIDRTIAAQEQQRSLDLSNNSGDHTGEPQNGTEETRAFEAFLRNGEETRALDVGNNGVIIPTTIADRIIQTVKEICPIYALATTYNIGGDLLFPVYDDAGEDTGAAFVEDLTELTESAGKFTQVKLGSHIVGVLKKVSKSLVNRTDFDLTSYIIYRVAMDLSIFLEKALLVGTAGKNTGVFDSTVFVKAPSATVITADDLISVQMKVPQAFQKDAVWIMHKDTAEIIRKMKDSDGRYLFQQDPTSPFGWTLFGKPIFYSENAPKMSAGAAFIAYGDMHGLYVKLSQGMEIQVLLEKYATQHAVGVVGYTEFDSKIVEKQRFALLKAGTAA